jgi:hypothetical protein
MIVVWLALLSLTARFLFLFVRARMQRVGKPEAADAR